MARANRLTSSLIAYFFVGAVLGAIAGILAHYVLSSAPAQLFEGRVMLFRLPGNNVNHAARDFLEIAISQPGFIAGFIEKHDLSPEVIDSLQELKVVARDPSSPNAELQLTGSDEEQITKTLDALAIYVTEALRTFDEGTKNEILQSLDKEIEAANSDYLARLKLRGIYGAVSDELKQEIAKSAKLHARRLELELSQRYRLAPLSSMEEETLQQDISEIIQAQERQERHLKTFSGSSSRNGKFALELALNEALTQALRQTKQRIVITYNQDTPIRIANRAKLTPITLEPSSAAKPIGLGAFIGALLGGLLWSRSRTQDSALTGLNIERRFNVPTFAVISPKLAERGEREGRPLAIIDPQSEHLACIRSLNLAVHLLKSKATGAKVLTFVDLSNRNNSTHVIANLAIEMRNRGQSVLVVETNSDKIAFSSLLEPAQAKAWALPATLQQLANEEAKPLSEQAPYIVYVEQDEWHLSPELVSQFDCVLIHAQDIADAKKRRLEMPESLLLVLCTTDTQVSKLRKALGRGAEKKMHGVVLCNLKR